MLRTTRPLGSTWVGGVTTIVAVCTNLGLQTLGIVFWASKHHSSIEVPRI